MVSVKQVQYSYVSMSLESGKEPLKTPDTLEEVVAKYFSYPDVGTPEQLVNRVQATFAMPNARNYAEALMELANRESMQKVVDLADDMKKAMLGDARRLHMPVSAFGRDRSWAMWDIGKQFYLSKHPDKSSDEYKDKLADPMADTQEGNEKKLEIVNRHIGWEARRAYSRNISKWKEEVSSKEALFASAMPLLSRPPEKSDGQLHSYELTELGSLLHQIAPSVEEQRKTEKVQPAAASPEADAVHTTETRTETHAEGSEPLTPEKTVENTGEKVVIEKVKVTNKKEGVTPLKVAKAAGFGVLIIPGSLIWVFGKEVGKAAWESVKGIFGVFKKWFQSGSLFGFLNRSPAGGGGGGGGHKEAHAPKKEEHKEEHKEDHGHGGGGHH
jgi:hypothetical protein